MSRNVSVLIAALSMLLMSGCVHFSMGRSADPVADIRSVLDAQVEAWNRGDLEGFMHGYWKDDALRFASGGKETRGWNATLAHYRSRYTTRELMGELRFSELDIHLLGDKDAYVFGHWQLKRGSDRPHGVFTLILHDTHKGWRVVHDHTSSE